jgi:hypothetical protein
VRGQGGGVEGESYRLPLNVSIEGVPESLQLGRSTRMNTRTIAIAALVLVVIVIIVVFVA